MNKKKGFTLAELLIVVAIIAVLVGVAIPVFTSQLEKSREAVDLANIRSAYAECTTALLTGEANDASVVAEGKGFKKEVTLKQTKAGWTGDNANAVIGNVTIPAVADGQTKITVHVSETGATSFT